MKFAEPNKPHRKSGIWGTQDLWSVGVKSFTDWRGIANVFSGPGEVHRC